jgi:transposase InsO family protein
MGLIRILTDRGTEYCGKPETHDYQLYLALNDIEHTRTKAYHPQTNDICGRFHKTILQGVLPGRLPAKDIPVNRRVAN